MKDCVSSILQQKSLFNNNFTSLENIKMEILLKNFQNTEFHVYLERKYKKPPGRILMRTCDVQLDQASTFESTFRISFEQPLSHGGSLGDLSYLMEGFSIYEISVYDISSWHPLIFAKNELSESWLTFDFFQNKPVIEKKILQQIFLYLRKKLGIEGKDILPTIMGFLIPHIQVTFLATRK